MKKLRYERKFILSNRNAQHLDSVLILHPAGFRVHYPDRQINNVYFDTPELKTFYENVLGVPIRSKYRMRWYGQLLKNIDAPVFEIKKKENELGYKKSLVGEKVEANLMAINNYGQSKFNSQLSLEPSLLNSYIRSYYISFDKKYRLTIDRDLKYYFALGKMNFPKSYVQMDQLIIELKYDEDNDESAKELMKYLPFRQSKSSKYVQGIYKVCR